MATAGEQVLVYVMCLLVNDGTGDATTVISTSKTRLFIDNRMKDY